MHNDLKSANQILPSNLRQSAEHLNSITHIYIPLEFLYHFPIIRIHLNPQIVPFLKGYYLKKVPSWSGDYTNEIGNFLRKSTIYLYGHYSCIRHYSYVYHYSCIPYNCTPHIRYNYTSYIQCNYTDILYSYIYIVY